MKYVAAVAFTMSRYTLEKSWTVRRVRAPVLGFLRMGMIIDRVSTADPHLGNPALPEAPKPQLLISLVAVVSVEILRPIP